MSDDSQALRLLSAILYFTFFVVLPWIFLYALSPEGKLSIVWNQPQKEELAACHAENQQILDTRDVYCVKEFGRPNNTWQWVWGSVWMLMGGVVYIYGAFIKKYDPPKKRKPTRTQLR